MSDASKLVVCVGFPGLLPPRYLERLRAVDARVEPVGLPIDPDGEWQRANPSVPHDEPPPWAEGVAEARRSVLAEAEVLIALHSPADLMRHAPGLRWVQGIGAGVEQFAKAGVGPFRTVREVPLASESAVEVGAEIRAGDVFSTGDSVSVTGVTKGRGMAGVMKRHGFSGFPASHGTHEYFRHGGAIGNRSYPGRVFKGKGMPGRMGGVRVTTPNLTVVDVRGDESLLLVRGAVPGARGGLVVVRRQEGAAR